MSKDKPKFWKRIFAIISGAFLALGIHTHQVTSLSGSYGQDSKRIESADRLDDYKKEYKDFEQAGNGVISLKDILITNVDDGICDSMVPQGLTMTDKYILVSAYCGIDAYRNELKLNSFSKKFAYILKGEYNHKKHHSVIYVYDREKKKLLITLQLADKNHVGGITFDGEFVYVAKSKDKQVSRILYDKIQKIVESTSDNGQKAARIEYDETIDVNRDASFVTVRTVEKEKELWVGTFSEFPMDSVIESYKILDDGKLEFNQMLPIELFSQRSRFCKIRESRIFGNIKFFWKTL